MAKLKPWYLVLHDEPFEGKSSVEFVTVAEVREHINSQLKYRKLDDYEVFLVSSELDVYELMAKKK